MRDAFDDAKKAGSSVPDMTAAQAVMTNIIDWDHHAAYDGQRLIGDALKTLDRSVYTNIKALCPHMGQSEILSHYSDLLINRWMGDFNQIKDTTEKVIDACLRAEHGDRTVLNALDRQLGRKLEYMEKNYADNATSTDLPLHVVADAMDSSEDGSKYHNAHKQAAGYNTMRDIVEKMAPNDVRAKRQGLFGFLKPR